MADVASFAGTFKEYLPRSIPPSFNPSTILHGAIKGIEARRKLERAFPMLNTATPK